jgi:hypothetical protein
MRGLSRALILHSLNHFRPCVPGLVKAELSPSRQRQLCKQAPALVLHRTTAIERFLISLLNASTSSHIG